jgi:putative hydrolase of the HAD superfamily
MTEVVRAVFLDVDDTLVDYEAAAAQSFHRVLGPDADYDLWSSLDHYERFLAGELGFQAMRDVRMVDYLALIGRSADVSRAVEIERERFDGLADFYALYDDVLPVLTELRTRGLQLGLITNNEADHQWAKIRAVGLDQLVDAVAISGEVGVAKPDRRIFDHACAQLGVSPAEALHVGDNFYADVRGAHGAGLRAVWLNRVGAPDQPEPEHVAITALPELLALVA